MIVMEAGASVTFCLKPEALETESISSAIKSSRLMSNKFGVSSFFCAKVRVEARSGKRQSGTKTSARRNARQPGDCERHVQEFFGLEALCPNDRTDTISGTIKTLIAEKLF